MGVEMRDTFGKRLLVASGALAVLVALIFATMLIAIGEQRDSSRSARQAQQRIAAANALQALVLNLETGARGYVITQQEPFLDPWKRNLAAFPAAVAALEKLSAPTPRRPPCRARHRRGHPRVHRRVRDTARRDDARRPGCGARPRQLGRRPAARGCAARALPHVHRGRDHGLRRFAGPRRLGRSHGLRGGACGHRGRGAPDRGIRRLPRPHHRDAGPPDRRDGGASRASRRHQPRGPGRERRRHPADRSSRAGRCSPTRSSRSSRRRSSGCPGTPTLQAARRDHRAADRSRVLPRDDARRSMPTRLRDAGSLRARRHPAGLPAAHGSRA